jgi:hypothetical protein
VSGVFDRVVAGTKRFRRKTLVVVGYLILEVAQIDF